MVASRVATSRPKANASSPSEASARRRVSLLHAQGLSWARIGEVVGHADLVTTARTDTVLVDEEELDYASLLAATA